jgi:hypothetical protein
MQWYGVGADEVNLAIMAMLGIFRSSCYLSLIRSRQNTCPYNRNDWYLALSHPPVHLGLRQAAMASMSTDSVSTDQS